MTGLVLERLAPLKMLKKLGNKLLKKFDKTLSFEGALKDL